jgi:nitrogen regulatory protein P-II 1
VGEAGPGARAAGWHAACSLPGVRRITAIVRPTRLEPVLCALARAGVLGATVSEVRGFGRQKGQRELHRGAGFADDLVPKRKIECVVPEDRLVEVVRALARAARTGRVGDGKIWIGAVAEVVRIRTGERGDAALG